MGSPSLTKTKNLNPTLTSSAPELTVNQQTNPTRTPGLNLLNISVTQRLPCESPCPPGVPRRASSLAVPRATVQPTQCLHLEAGAFIIIKGDHPK